jgi:RNA polymerase sigma-70 factor (ECF subfamily)
VIPWTSDPLHDDGQEQDNDIQPPRLQPDDGSLITRIRAGDEDAFVLLVDRYMLPLYRFAYVRTRDQALSEDVVQDVFAHLWNRRTQIDIHGNVQSYLFRAVRNRALNALRHERSHDRIASVLKADTTEYAATRNEGEAAVEYAELLQIARRALEELSPRTQQIFLLRREQQMSYADIADILGLSILSVRNQVSRATRAIFLALKKSV